MIQKTYTMIKPDAFHAKDEIIQKIEAAGFKILQQKAFKMTEEFAKNFYAEHDGKSFFPGLVEFMTSGSVYAMVLEKEDCISGFREFIGATDPQKAASGTIRQLYGKELPYNAIHASDSPSSADREIRLAFA